MTTRPEDAITAVDTLKSTHQGDAVNNPALRDAGVGALMAGSQGPGGEAYAKAFAQRAGADPKLMQQLGLDNLSIVDPHQIQSQLDQQGIHVQPGQDKNGNPISVVFDKNEHSTTYVDTVGNAQSFKVTNDGVEVNTNGVATTYKGGHVDLNPDGTPKLDETKHIPIITDNNGNQVIVHDGGVSETTVKSGPAAGEVINKDAAGNLTGYTTPQGEQVVVGKDGNNVPTINGHSLEKAPPNAKVDIDTTTGKSFYELPANDGKSYKVDVDPATGKMQTIHGTDGTSIDYRKGNDGQMHWFNDSPKDHHSEQLAGDPEILGSGDSPRIVRMKWQKDGNSHTLHGLA